MRASLRLTVERLAPTGEGVAHESGKVVFVDGALPGETIEAEIFEEKARHARASTAGVLEASPDRRPADAHAASCGGTDWAHVEVEAARRFKRELFLETMARLGGIAAHEFGELPISSSPLEYRLRNQFHASAGEAGFFARRSHRVVPIDGCEIVSRETRGKIRRLAAEAEGTGGTIETLETVETGARHRLVWRAEGLRLLASDAALDVDVGGRPFCVSAGSFFQVNRHRIAPFFEQIRELAAEVAPRAALDAYAGAGFLTHALVEAGARVTAVESDPSSAADAAFNRARFGAERRIDLRTESVEAFLRGPAEPADVVVADPPRGGLRAAAAALSELARRRLIYVSCEPASLARDLKPLLAGGLTIERAWLEDFFPLTHRVEAVVSLGRP
ncbi:MAG TPA: TRAM domain-containing protein [Thermoanaerobaculia bacterium]|nr:TRAM domain-containing protein [Thermoanaerobaculia bacterium]